MAKLNTEIKSQNKFIKKSVTNDKELEEKLASKDLELSQALKRLSEFKLINYDQKLLLMNTINVKLRYEKII